MYLILRIFLSLSLLSGLLTRGNCYASFDRQVCIDREIQDAKNAAEAEIVAVDKSNKNDTDTLKAKKKINEKLNKKINEIKKYYNNSSDNRCASDKDSNNSSGSNNENSSTEEMVKSFDGKILCIRQTDNGRSICNIDFDSCRSFVNFYNGYYSKFAVQGVVEQYLPSTKATSSEDINARVATIIQATKQSGQDINMSAFGLVEEEAKKAIKRYNEELAIHLALAGKLSFIYFQWKDEDNLKKSPACADDNINCYTRESDIGVNNEKSPPISVSCCEAKDLDVTFDRPNICSKQSVIMKDSFSEYIENISRTLCQVVFKENDIQKCDDKRADKVFNVILSTYRHLCDVNITRYKYIIPNTKNKPLLLEFMNLIATNIINIRARIKEIEGYIDELNKAKLAYLDSMNKPTPTGTATAAAVGNINCKNNPFMAGCINTNQSGGGTSGGNPNVKPPGNKNPVIPGDGPIHPHDATDTNDGGIVDLPAPASPGEATSGGDGGSSGGGGEAEGVAGAPTSKEDDKDKNKDESGAIDISGVSDYGSKKKRTAGGTGTSSESNQASKEKKVKNPFEDMFGDKGDGKDNGGVHLRDIASSNADEDEENGFSNIFSRISKTYTKLYLHKSLGDKN